MAACGGGRRYHQYKFIVDGDWRHDESQPYMPDPLGNVNNWLFVRRQDGSQPSPGCAPRRSPLLAGMRLLQGWLVWSSEKVPRTITPLYRRPIALQDHQRSHQQPQPRCAVGTERQPLPPPA